MAMKTSYSSLWESEAAEKYMSISIPNNLPEPQSVKFITLIADQLRPQFSEGTCYVRTCQGFIG
jgi:hypothetical protein